jgi:hypothetical protein
MILLMVLQDDWVSWVSLRVPQTRIGMELPGGTHAHTSTVVTGGWSSWGLRPLSHGA